MSSVSPNLPPIPSNTDPSHFSGPETSSNLYLVTFLATLFLLLFVSCGIVLRSYILRRRYQRRLEDALGSGLLLAPRAQGSKRQRLGAKPEIINTWLADGGEKWSQMMPLSAQPVFVKRKVRENPVAKQNLPSDTTTTQPSTTVPDATATNPSRCPTAPPTSTNNGSNRMSNLFSRFCRSTLHSSQNTDLVHTAATGTKQAPPGSAPNYRIRVEMLQLSVLISMPSPNKSQRKNHILENTDPDRDEEEEVDDEASELPNMVFGVTRVNYRQPKSTLSSKLPKSPI